ncbi:MAG: Asp-tRNA(Asn)/Glu-tRNA(Gln) amidotransferase subunit GatA [Planctomycetota bacterium]|nr:MAG: Asp-tRNA(Asn)/Glu-tRNA(Gln) amidotransferase subunit GatA [Planctomycetota bacterium]
MSLAGMPCRELHAKLRSGELSSREAVQAALEAIGQRDGTVQAFVDVWENEALLRAEEIDRRRAAGQPVGALAGLPVAVKDNLCTYGRRTSCASRMLENFRPPYDAHVIERLQAADAVIVGKTNLDEFAMGSSSEHSAFQVTRNPWNPEHSPGGSSGGSAAAVAAEMVPAAVGSDTGGSIRQPASFCGVVGLKPTYGRVSRYGLVAFASSLDQIGPLANDVYGCAMLLEVLAGHDPRDATCLNVPVPEYVRSVDEAPERLRVGVVEEFMGEGVDDEVRSAVDRVVGALRDLGAVVESVSLPHARYAVATYYIVAPSEASSNLARYDGIHYGYRAEAFENLEDLYARTRGEAFGSEVKRRIMLGTYALSAGYYDAYYLKALKVRRLIRQDYDRAFERVDVLVGPVAPTPAFRLGEMLEDPLTMYLADVFTIGANLAGLPGISVPAAMSSQGLPIGVQLIGPPLSEERLLRAARLWERHCPRTVLGRPALCQ